MKVEFDRLEKVFKGHAAIASLSMQVPECQMLVIIDHQEAVSPLYCG